jgi:hypothetical protein
LSEILMRVASLVGVWMLLLTVSAEAGAGGRCDNGDVFNDAGDRLSLGSVLMGAGQTSLPKTVRKLSDECPDSHGMDKDYCVYTDDTGLSYVMRGHEVWRKEARDLFSYSGDIIADVRAGDSVLDVFRKLATLPRKFPQWHYQALEKGFAIATAPCLRSSNGAVWDYQFIFDGTGKLTSVISASQAYWDEYRSTQ